jgi:hypothetical protein
MFFLCCLIFKYDALTASDDLQDKMSLEQVHEAQAAHCCIHFAVASLLALRSQRENFIVSDWVLSMLLLHSIWSSLLVAGGLVVVQIAADAKRDARLRRLKYVVTGFWVECQPLSDPQAYHLFLSHACASSSRHGAYSHRSMKALKLTTPQITTWQGLRRRIACASSKRACSSVCPRAAPSSMLTVILLGELETARP